MLLLVATYCDTLKQGLRDDNKKKRPTPPPKAHPPSEGSQELCGIACREGGWGEEGGEVFKGGVLGELNTQHMNPPL